MSQDYTKIAIDQINHLNNRVLQWQNRSNTEDFNQGIAPFLLDISKYVLRTLHSFNDEKSPNLIAYSEGVYTFLKNILDSTNNYLSSSVTERTSSIWNRKNNPRDNLIQSISNALQVQVDAYNTYFAKENEKVKSAKSDDFSMNPSNNRNFISPPTINDTYKKWNLMLPLEQCKDNFIYWLKTSALIKFLIFSAIAGGIVWGGFIVIPKMQGDPDVPYFLVNRVYNEIKARGNDLNAVKTNIEAINKSYSNETMPINFKLEGKEIHITLPQIDDDNCNISISYRQAIAPDDQGRTFINGFEILDKAGTPNPYISSLQHPASNVCYAKDRNDVVLILNTEKIYNQNNKLEDRPSAFYLEKLKGIVDNYEYIRSYNNTSSARTFFNSYYAPQVVNYLKNLTEQDSALFVKYMKKATKEDNFREWLAEQQK